MRQEKILFEKAVRRTSLFWKFTGIQIDYDEKLTKLSFFGHLRRRSFYIGNFICLSSGLLGWFATMYLLNIQKILYMIPCVTFSLLGDIKSFYLLYYENIVCDIINTLRKLQSIDNSEGKEAVDNEFVKKRLPLLNAGNKLLLFVGYTGVAAFFIGPLAIMCWQYWFSNDMKLFLPYAVWYPFNEYSYEGWPLAYLHQFWSAWVAVFYVYGPDRFFYTACTFVHSQFCSLQFDLQKIGTFRNKDSFNTYIGTMMYRHRELIRCVEMINLIYGKSTLFNVLSSSFIICLAGFNIKAIDNLILMMPFAVFLLLGFVQIFLLCYYGDLLMHASIEVSDAIFKSNWHKLDASSMKFCLFVLMRAQKPCKITAFGYTDINLATFSRIVSSSWSYFTILNTMYSKHG